MFSWVFKRLKGEGINKANVSAACVTCWASSQTQTAFCSWVCCVHVVLEVNSSLTWRFASGAWIIQHNESAMTFFCSTFKNRSLSIQSFNPKMIIYLWMSKQTFWILSFVIFFILYHIGGLLILVKFNIFWKSFVSEGPRVSDSSTSWSLSGFWKLKDISPERRNLPRPRLWFDVFEECLRGKYCVI